MIRLILISMVALSVLAGFCLGRCMPADEARHRQRTSTNMNSAAHPPLRITAARD
jgi:hypothetical protein